jgi:hypothetical protein
MPWMSVCPLSSSVVTRNDGSSNASFCSPTAHLVLVGLGLGLDRDGDDGLGEGHALEQLDGVLVVAEGVAGARVAEAHHGGDDAGEDVLDVFALVGVHQEQATDALVLAAGAVEHAVARLRASPSTPG